jgi:hypothetical protein
MTDPFYAEFKSHFLDARPARFRGRPENNGSAQPVLEKTDHNSLGPQEMTEHGEPDSASLCLSEPMRRGAEINYPAPLPAFQKR